MTGVDKRHKILLIVLLALLPLTIVLHLFSGQLELNLSDFTNALTNFDPDDSKQLIAREIRLPRMIMAFLAGSALSVAGLLMQTLFNNPLAGPYVLGINSGASLFVAFSFMTGIPLLTSDLGTVSSALIGAFLFGLIIMSFAMMVRSHVSLLLVGLMLGSFTSAIVYIVQTASEADELKAFTMWAMGSLQHVEWAKIPLVLLLVSIGLLASFTLIKSLNALVLGESDALLLGIRVRRVRILVIAITALLTGIITAYCGPIAFVGLAIPNLVRLLFKTQRHGFLIAACILTGGIFLLLSDSFLQMLEGSILIPINAFTSLIGAPFVVFIILKRLA